MGNNVLSTTDKGYNLSKEEIAYLLDYLNNLLEDDNLREEEEQLVIFLIGQLNKIKGQSSGEKKNHLELVESRKGDQSSDLRGLLKKRLDEFIRIDLKDGDEDWKVEGILAGIGRDFIVLINDSTIIQLRISEIAAIRTELNSFLEDDGKKRKSKVEFVTQSYQDDELEDDYSNSLSATKEERSYTRD